MIWCIKQCPKCGGDLYVEEDYYGKYIACLQCGMIKDLNITKKELIKIGD